jgi:hypothetical protein
MTTAELKSPAPQTGPIPDAEAYALETTMRSLVALGASMHPRTRQKTVGMSEVGRGCARRLAYKMADATPVNLTDPLRALVGAGVHAAMAETFRRLDGGSGRFLVEVPLRYRGVPGTCDLYDRLTGTVVDWKTTMRAKIGRLRVDGPSVEYVTQVQLYAAALATQGEDVRAVALVFVPVDSTLADLWAWRGVVDAARADAAVDRLNGIHALDWDTRGPSVVDPSPGPLCKFCEYHNPSSADADLACKGATA